MSNNTVTLQNVDAVAPEEPKMDTLSMFAPMLLILVVFYFLLIRPQEKKRKEQETMIAGVKIGEKIVTSSGIFGTITAIDNNHDTVMVMVSQNVEIKILKNNIADIVSRHNKGKDDQKSKDNKKDRKGNKENRADKDKGGDKENKDHKDHKEHKDKRDDKKKS